MRGKPGKIQFGKRKLRKRGKMGSDIRMKWKGDKNEKSNMKERGTRSTRDKVAI